jgi:NAD-dependent dihydropyrimidine dehydrogenase PreA subunit
MGGPSGGCVPEKFLDLGIDYDSVKDVGTIMGSGGLIVMDESTCMVDVARYFLQFVQSESCGKCTPCRVGTKEMLHILDAICEGKATTDELSRLERLADHVGKASLCGLGQTAPNPVMTTLRYFRNEYEDHIDKNQCPAFVCTSMLSFHIDPDRCTGCGSCARVCPVEAITGEKKEIHIIDREICIRCGACLGACPARFAAVYRRSGELTRREKQVEPKSKN